MSSDKEGEDYYLEHGLTVFTEAYHLKRGYCCKSGCRHCPFGYRISKKQKIAISWSGGKDSALALQRVLKDDLYEVDHLFTTFDKETRRVGLHGIPEHLIEKQAAALDLPLNKLYLESSDNHDHYETLMIEYFSELKSKGINQVMFGDIYLQDLRDYRDSLLKKAGIIGVYPLWQKESERLMNKFLRQGFKTIVCAGKYPLIKVGDLGRVIDPQFIDELPEEVDVCGENGEFHTFVFDGPIFKNSIKIEKGKVVEKTYTYKSVDHAGKEEEHKSIFLFQELY